MKVHKMNGIIWSKFVLNYWRVNYLSWIRHRAHLVSLIFI